MLPGYEDGELNIFEPVNFVLHVEEGVVDAGVIALVEEAFVVELVKV